MRVVKTEVIDNDTGEIIAQKTTYGTNNGGGWVICYRKGSEILASRCDSSVTFRVFHLLISRLNSFEAEGAVCSRKWLQEKLGVSRKSIYNALRWLSANDFIVEAEHDGFSEFFFNPEFVTVGKKKTDREKRWCELKTLAFTREQCKIHGLPFPLPHGVTLEKALEQKYSFEKTDKVSIGDVNILSSSGAGVVAKN